MIKSILFVVISAFAGGFLGLAHSDSAPGAVLRDEIAGFLGPAADVAAAMRDQQTFFMPNYVTGNPQSIFDAFQVEGKIDKTFAGCLRDVGALDTKGMRQLADLHEHNITTSLVNCALTKNRQRFCNPERRQHVAAAMELYLWSRDYNFNNRKRLDDVFRMDHLNEPSVELSDLDPWYKTWDGPADRDLYENLKKLARYGYINPDLFGLLPRYEIRQAMEGVKIETVGCAGVDLQGT